MAGKTLADILSDLGVELVAMAISATVYVATLVLIAIAIKAAKRAAQRREAPTLQAAAVR